MDDPLQQAWQEANLTRIHKLLNQYLPAEGQPDLRGVEWYCWWRLSHAYNQSLEHRHPVLASTVSPDGRLLASATSANKLQFWNPNSGAPLEAVDRLPSHIDSLAFSPDGRILATGNAKGVVQLWIDRDGHCRATLFVRSDTWPVPPTVLVIGQIRDSAPLIPADPTDMERLLACHGGPCRRIPHHITPQMGSLRRTQQSKSP